MGSRAAEEEGLLVAEVVRRGVLDCGEDAFVRGGFSEASGWGVVMVVIDVRVVCSRLVVIVLWLFQDDIGICMFAA